MPLKLISAGGGSLTITPTSTASNYTLTVPAITGNLVTTDSNGNVGIGTSTPASLFEVYTGLATFAKGGNNGITIGDVSTNSGSCIRLQGTNATYNWLIDNNVTATGLSITPSTATGGTTYTTPLLFLSGAGNVGIGTSSPSAKLDINKGSSGLLANFTDGVNANFQISTTSLVTTIGPSAGSTSMVLQTGATERMRIDTNGNVGIGTSANLVAPFTVQTSSSTGTGITVGSRFLESTNGYGLNVGGSSTGYAWIQGLRGTTSSLSYNDLAIQPNGGSLLIGKTTTALGTVGIRFVGNDTANMTVNQGTIIDINRLNNDGTLIGLYQDSVQEGQISVSGTTITYAAFTGSHWSQLHDGSKPEILRGTVLESIDELCEWPDEEPTERLCKVKISDTLGSKRVYGVFLDWDNDWEATNDMLVTSIGAFVCRVNKDEVVQIGDLLESNGDGTAKVQDDDIIRSKTIGKVTCTEKTTIHPDESYCVPTVLYCG